MEVLSSKMNLEERLIHTVSIAELIATRRTSFFPTHPRGINASKQNQKAHPRKTPRPKLRVARTPQASDQTSHMSRPSFPTFSVFTIASLKSTPPQPLPTIHWHSGVVGFRACYLATKSTVPPKGSNPPPALFDRLFHDNCYAGT